MWGKDAISKFSKNVKNIAFYKLLCLAFSVRANSKNIWLVTVKMHLVLKNKENWAKPHALERYIYVQIIACQSIWC